MSSQTGVSADNRGPIWLRAGCLHLHAKAAELDCCRRPGIHALEHHVASPPSLLVLGDVRLTSKTLLSIPRVHRGTRRLNMAAGANHWPINVSVPPLGFVLPTVTVDRSEI